MEAELGDDYDAADVDAMAGADGEAEEEDPAVTARWRCNSTAVRDRVEWVQALDQV